MTGAASFYLFYMLCGCKEKIPKKKKRNKDGRAKKHPGHTHPDTANKKLQIENVFNTTFRYFGFGFGFGFGRTSHIYRNIYIPYRYIDIYGSLTVGRQTEMACYYTDL